MLLPRPSCAPVFFCANDKSQQRRRQQEGLRHASRVFHQDLMDPGWILRGFASCFAAIPAVTVLLLYCCLVDYLLPSYYCTAALLYHTQCSRRHRHCCTTAVLPLYYCTSVPSDDFTNVLLLHPCTSLMYHSTRTGRSGEQKGLIS